jgi:hypothetical protein
LKRVIPFLFIALLLEEVIPLIAIWAPSTLPSTCILPSQLERIEEKLTEKTLTLLAENKQKLLELRKFEEPIGHLTLDTLLQVGASAVICG